MEKLKNNVFISVSGKMTVREMDEEFNISVDMLT